MTVRFPEVRRLFVYHVRYWSAQVVTTLPYPRAKPKETLLCTCTHNPPRQRWRRAWGPYGVFLEQVTASIGATPNVSPGGAPSAHRDGR